MSQLSASTDPSPIRVAVIDMQPITPAVGGGRLRLLGLYHALGPEFHTTYVGTFDWPGEAARELRLTDTLTEIEVPLSEEHFQCDAIWRGFAGGATIIDAAFPVLGRLSPAFLGRARDVVRMADVVVFSHPWTYPLLVDTIDPTRQFVIYDAQNIEAVLRYGLLDGSPFGREIAKGVAMAEAFLCRSADLVIGCSTEDVNFFADAYGIRADRTAVVPNGVFVRSIMPRKASEINTRDPSVQNKTGAIAIFIGSKFAPNVEAATFIVRSLAPALPDVMFLVCGGVADEAVLQIGLPPNVGLVGCLSDADKLRLLHAADVALNPMFFGSGTNIKMLEFMAAGLPIVATEVGARGICDASADGIILCASADIARAVDTLLRDPELRLRMGLANRKRAEREFAWETLSPDYGGVIKRMRHGRALDRISEADCGISASHARGIDPARDSFVSIPHYSPIAIMSTFGIHCGIAEYTAYLAEALLGAGTPLAIIANLHDGQDQDVVSDHAALSQVRVERLWRYDSAAPSSSQVNPGELVKVLRTLGTRHLNIQYHRGFFPEATLLDLVAAVLADGTAVSVSLHNSSDATPGFLAQLREMPVPVLVHRPGEEERLRSLGLHGAAYLPQGVRSHTSTPDSDIRAVRSSQDEGPVIATFGFLRPHKGLLELVETLPILRSVFPGVRLRAYTALYPSPDSTAYLERVRARIESLGLGDLVVVDHAFQRIDAAIASLAEADIVVLPYAASDEGSSAAAAAAIAARRPLITTRARIFDELRGVAYMAEDNSPPVLAAAIATVISNAALRLHLQRRSAAVADARSWHRVAREWLAVISSTIIHRAEPVG